MPGPAVVLEKALAPAVDRGRFNLRVNGRLVARRAGDGTIAGPTRVGVGSATVSERAAPGTRASAYRSAVQCHDRAGRVIVTARGTRATFPVRGAEVVHCVLLNAGSCLGPTRTRRPSPSPCRTRPGARLGAGGGRRGEPRPRHARGPLERGIAVGGTAEFRITISNRAR